MEAAGGVILLSAAVVAMVIANTPAASAYENLLKTSLELRIGNFGIDKPLILWINDGLMAIFFFLVGLELKREMLEGHMASLRQASLPAFAALGGMAVPALIYAAFNHGNAEALGGWAIPSATDIAFALGVLALLGRRVPTPLKIFLLGVAIFDDLGAIVIIALFYSADMSLLALGVAAGLVLGLLILNRCGVRRPAAYFLLGVPLWIAVLKSGVHATLAGVVLALFIPVGPSRGGVATADQPSPLRELEHALHPWVAFGVLPIFAFANAGVPLTGLSFADLIHPVPLGIALGLIIGKPVGIMLMCLLAATLRLTRLPGEVRWSELWGASVLCGIGFTMSLFIASLAFEQRGVNFQGLERVGILAGSLLAGIAGYLVLRFVLPSASQRAGHAGT